MRKILITWGSGFLGGDLVTLAAKNGTFMQPISVGNIAAALLELAENQFIGTINLGGPERIDRYNFGQQYCRIVGLNTKLLKPIWMDAIKQDALRPGDVSMTITLARQVLKTPFLDIQAGIRQMNELPG